MGNNISSDSDINRKQVSLTISRMEPLVLDSKIEYGKFYSIRCEISNLKKQELDIIDKFESGNVMHDYTSEILSFISTPGIKYSLIAQPKELMYINLEGDKEKSLVQIFKEHIPPHRRFTPVSVPKDYTVFPIDTIILESHISMDCEYLSNFKNNRNIIFSMKFCREKPQTKIY
jgi:hypothetical protein